MAGGRKPGKGQWQGDCVQKIDEREGRKTDGGWGGGGGEDLTGGEASKSTTFRAPHFVIN